MYKCIKEVVIHTQHMCSIPLRGKYGMGKEVVVSECDYEFLKERKLSVLPNGYVMYYCRDSQTTHYLHRWLMGCDSADGKTVDHKDGDKLNCTRENLNVTTRSKNASNKPKVSSIHNPASSQYVGVRKNGNKWVAVIKKDKVQHRLGTFDTEEEAAFAYNRKAIELHRTYAVLNIIDGRVT